MGRLRAKRQMTDATYATELMYDLVQISNGDGREDRLIRNDKTKPESQKEEK